MSQYSYKTGDFFIVLTNIGHLEGIDTPKEYDDKAVSTAVGAIAPLLPNNGEDYTFVSVSGEYPVHAYPKEIAVVTGDDVGLKQLSEWESGVMFGKFGVGEFDELVEDIEKRIPKNWTRAVLVMTKKADKTFSVITHNVHMTPQRISDKANCNCDTEDNQYHRCMELGAPVNAAASVFAAPQTTTIPGVVSGSDISPQGELVINNKGGFGYEESQKLRKLGSTTPKIEKLMGILRKQSDMNKAALFTGKAESNGHRHLINSAAIHQSNLVGDDERWCNCESDVCIKVKDNLIAKENASKNGREPVKPISFGRSHKLSDHPSIIEGISSFGGAPFDRHLIYTQDTSVMRYMSELLKSMKVPHAYVSALDTPEEIDCVLQKGFESLDEEACHWYKELRRERRAMEKRSKIHDRSVKAFDKLLETESGKACLDATPICGIGSVQDYKAGTVTRAELIQDIDSSIKICESIEQAEAAALRFSERGTPWILLTDTLISKDKLTGSFTHLHILDAGADSVSLLESLAHRIELEKCYGIKERGTIAVHYHITKSECNPIRVMEEMTKECEDDDLSTCCSIDTERACCGDDGVTVTYKGLITKEVTCEEDGLNQFMRRGGVMQLGKGESHLMPGNKIGTVIGNQVTPYEEEFETDDGNVKRIVHGVEISSSRFIPPEPIGCSNEIEIENTKKTITKIVDIETVCTPQTTLFNSVINYQSFNNGFSNDCEIPMYSGGQDELRFNGLMREIQDKDVGWMKAANNAYRA